MSAIATVRYSTEHVNRETVRAQQASRDACPDDGLVEARQRTRNENPSDESHVDYRRRLTAWQWDLNYAAGNVPSHWSGHGLPSQYRRPEGEVT